MDRADPMDGPRCRALSKQSQEQCRRVPIRGGAVCNIHGGKAPQVRAKAEERIQAMVDPALTRLLKLIADDSSGVALAAVKDVLDRAGYGAKQQVEITLRQQAAQLATEYGLDPDELMAEAERIVASSR